MRSASGSLDRFVVQDHQLPCVQGQAGKSTAVVVGELDLESVRSKQLHDGSHLPPAQLAVRQILRQSHNVEKARPSYSQLLLYCSNG